MGDKSFNLEESRADRFCDKLLSEEALKPINLNDEIQLPDFYDAELFKKGQKFIWRNLFSIFLSNVAGLLTVLTVQSVLEGVVYPTGSLFTISAWRRYLSIMRHTFNFYGSPLEPGSKSMKSLKKFKDEHLIGTIVMPEDKKPKSQRDVAIIQFGFMGYVLMRPKMLGIAESEEELAAFVHFWRVIGHCLQCSKYNLCADSLAETRDRVSQFSVRFIGPTFLTHTTTYLQIARGFVGIFWYLNPIVTLDSILFLNNRLVGIPGYYLNAQERDEQLSYLEEYKPYFRQFAFKRVELEVTVPKCIYYTEYLGFWDKMLINTVVYILEVMIYKRKFWRYFFNGLVVLVKYLINKFAFLTDQRREFKNSYNYFLRLRRRNVKSIENK